MLFSTITVDFKRFFSVINIIFLIKVQSWIFKSFSNDTATSTATATASAANKTWVFKSFSETPRETLEDHWHC